MKKQFLIVSAVALLVATGFAPRANASWLEQLQEEKKSSGTVDSSGGFDLDALLSTVGTSATSASPVSTTDVEEKNKEIALLTRQLEEMTEKFEKAEESSNKSVSLALLVKQQNWVNILDWQLTTPKTDLSKGVNFEVVGQEFTTALNQAGFKELKFANIDGKGNWSGHPYSSVVCSLIKVIENPKGLIKVTAKNKETVNLPDLFEKEIWGKSIKLLRDQLEKKIEQLKKK